MLTFVVCVCISKNLKFSRHPLFSAMDKDQVEVCNSLLSCVYVCVYRGLTLIYSNKISSFRIY